jgi:hypothetical protein
MNPSRKLPGTTSRKPAMRLNARIGPSRQQQRTEATRKALLDAAQQIFARDGFEMTVQICHSGGRRGLSSACGAFCCAHQFVRWRAEKPAHVRNI